MWLWQAEDLTMKEDDIPVPKEGEIIHKTGWSKRSGEGCKWSQKEPIPGAHITHCGQLKKQEKRKGSKNKEKENETLLK